MDRSLYPRIIFVIVYFIAVLIIMVDCAFAHRVIIFAWVDGDTVYTESKFSGGKKAKHALIEVFDAQNKKLCKGRTDDNGEFSFKVPQKTELKIVLAAGTGHKAQWIIPVEELGGNISEYEKKPVAQKPDVKSFGKINKPVYASIKNMSESHCVVSKELQNVVEKALDKKLKPIIMKINKSLDPYHGPTVSDIFGGIGYIFGLVGVGAYFYYRNKMKNI